MQNIKRIIFDLDDTLIKWKSKYTSALKATIKEYNLPHSWEDIDNLTTTYENIYNQYTIKNFIEHSKNTLNIELSEEFVKSWLDNLGNMSDEDQELNKVLAYLSKKYELVVLTNWFKDSQEKRLKNARMHKYFIEIYGGDKFIKPNKESFLQAIGNHAPEECLMIGDNYQIDILGAINCGLKAIYLTDQETNNVVPKIKDLKELKNIL